MSRPAKIVLLVVTLTTIGAALTAYFAQRNSPDGQGGALWPLLVFYGFVGVAIVWAVDSAVRRFRR
jgi:hypothetical protein